MASSSVKVIQDKLFRGGDDSNGLGSSDPDPRDPRLTIQIPKPTVKSEPPKVTKASPCSLSGTNRDTVQKNYRQRLNDRLGADYQGAERYRLQQDDARLSHWKRWGPYLSDRQWVSLTKQLPQCFDTHQPIPGDGPRGLFRKWGCLESFPSRTRTIARLSMGRRWHWWHLG